MPENVRSRIVIYPKDVSNITGLSPRTAWNLLNRIKKKYKKGKGQYITITEFSEHTGISKEEIKSFLVR